MPAGFVVSGRKPAAIETVVDLRYLSAPGLTPSPSSYTVSVTAGDRSARLTAVGRVSPDLLVFGRCSECGWYSRNAKDSGETIAFAAFKGIRPMVETHPPEEAEETFQNMDKAQFRTMRTI